MEIRSISRSDIGDLASLMVEVYSAPPWSEDWTEETAIDSLTCLVEIPSFYGNIIEDGGKIIGAILGYTRAYARERTYYISEFFLSNDYRRQGLASRLYRHSIEELRKKGITGAFFTTLKDSPAYKFYLKQGAWDLGDSACFYHRF